ncbi:MAG: 6-carboxytetrahydropterin synthase [Bacteroidota bacterium]
MSTVYVYRRAHFSAAHRVFDPALSDEENFDLFGGCSNPNGHGHNYYIEVCIAGEPNKKTGYVIDLKKVSDILRRHFVEKVDHKNLNTDVEFMKNVNPTTENIAIAAWKQIAPHITEGKLYSVRIYETEKNFVEYRGE